MGELTKTTLRGFLLPDPLITGWDSAAVVGTGPTQASPRAGRPVQDSSGDTSMVLRATGTQTADSTLTIRTQRGGWPEPGGAGYVWRKTSSEDYRGWDVPVAASAWEQVVWTTSATGDRYPHAVTCDSDRIIVAYSDVSGGDTRVSIRTRSSITGAWSVGGTVVYTETTVGYLYPSILELPSGRVQLFYVVYDGTLNLAQVSMHYSDDEGNSWKEGAKWVLPTPIDTSGNTIKRLRVAHGNGQYLLLVWYDDGADEILAQYASDNNGSSFDLVKTWSGGSGERGGNHDVVYSGGYFHAHWSDVDTTILTGGKGAKLVRVASAYTDILTGATMEPGAGSAAGLGNLFTDWDGALSADDDGTLYLWMRFFGGGGNGIGLVGIVYRSQDSGATWKNIGKSDFGSLTNGVWCAYYDVTGPSHIRHFHVVHQRGRAVALHNWEGTTSGTDWSIGALWLGGYTTVSMPQQGLLAADTKQVHWIRSWLPLELPGGVTGWTKQTSGGATESLANGKVSISSAGGGTDTILYRYDGPSGPTVAEGLICRWRVEVTSGTLEWDITNDDNAANYVVEILVTTTTITANDQNAATQIGQDTGLGGSYDVLVAMADDDVTIWYREVGADMSEDREWVELGTDATLTDGGAAVLGVHRWRMGCITAATAGAGDIYEHHICYDEYTGAHGLQDGIATADLFPRAYPTDSPTYVADGVSLRAIDGPTQTGDAWSIDTEYGYPVDAVLPSHSPSPRVGWRSTDTTGDVEIPFTRDALRPYMANWAFALYLDGINFRSFHLDGLRASWGELAQVDCYATVSFTRAGQSVIPRTNVNSGATGRYLARDQLAGGHFHFASTGEVRRISGNAAGYWSSGSEDEDRAVLYLEDVDDTEDAVGDDGEIWFPRVVVIVHKSGSQVDYETLRIEIDDGNTDPDPALGYYTIGTLAFGHLAVFGRDYDWGYSHEREAFTEVVELADGGMRTRNRGPSRRTYRIGWGEGVDVTDARGAGNDPDYVRISDDASARPIGSADTVPLQVDGLLDSLKGADTPVVFLPKIDVQTSVSGDSVQTYLWDRANGAIYGRLTSSSVRLESVVGDDLEDELLRVATVEITEQT